jgi:hypothetical protein
MGKGIAYAHPTPSEAMTEGALKLPEDNCESVKEDYDAS